MMITQVVFNNESGLHARPASDLVREASTYKSDILIRNVSLGSDWADAKSILSVLGLGVEDKHTIELKAEGPDEKAAIHSLKEMILSKLF
jgi:phosphocarrier protein HPr